MAKHNPDIVSDFLYIKSLKRCEKKNRQHKITKDYIKSILLKQHFRDYYTGLVPKDYHQYSIDRIDSDKDYEEGNIVITTVTINTMKGHQKLDEFYTNIKLLYNELVKGKQQT